MSSRAFRLGRLLAIPDEALMWSGRAAVVVTALGLIAFMGKLIVGDAAGAGAAGLVTIGGLAVLFFVRRLRVTKATCK